MSCAIYVPKRQLDVEKKNGGNQRGANFPVGFAPENGPHQVSSFLWETHEKTLFRGTWWGPFSGAKQSGNCQSVEHCKKYVFFRDIDGATPTHSPKSGWECPHRWRNSLISPDIHQPT